jgi:hypothetical protein
VQAQAFGIAISQSPIEPQEDQAEERVAKIGEKIPPR